MPGTSKRCHVKEHVTKAEGCSYLCTEDGRSCFTELELFFALPQEYLGTFSLTRQQRLFHFVHAEYSDRDDCFIAARSIFLRCTPLAGDLWKRIEGPRKHHQK